MQLYPFQGSELRTFKSVRYEKIYEASFDLPLVLHRQGHLPEDLRPVFLEVSHFACWIEYLYVKVSNHDSQ